MSYQSDFTTFINTYIKTNGANAITGQQMNDALSTWLAPRVAWLDETSSSAGGGFSGSWTLSDDQGATPSTAEFTVNDSTVSTIDEIKIHKTAIGPLAFNNSLNKISGFKLGNSDGEEFVYEVSEIETESSYIIFIGEYAGAGPLTELVVDEDYFIGFLFGDQLATVSNYFCTSWAQVKSAVAISNANNGGNIYMSGDITLTEDQSWDVTNIQFIGSSNCRWRVLNNDYVADGTQSKVITITAGSTSFSNVQFRGSGNGESAQLFANYTNRKIIKITSGDSDVNFSNCIFKDIIGGAGGASDEVIEYTKLDSGTGSSVNLNGCYFTSANNDVPFSMDGFVIKTSNHIGNLNVSAINHRIPVDRMGTDGTDVMFYGDLATPANTVFYTDGTARGEGDFDAAISSNPTTITENQAPILTDLISFTSVTDGQTYNMTLTQLQTLINV